MLAIILSTIWYLIEEDVAGGRLLAGEQNGVKMVEKLHCEKKF